MTIPILFGTESGNSEYCAETLADQLKAEGFDSSAVDMLDFEFESLSECKVIFIITSTYGNGEPPENAIDFLEYLQGNDLDLSHLSFAICALGDSSFPKFVQCGIDFENILLQHNAKQIFPRIDCDCDFEIPLQKFTDLSIKFISNFNDITTQSLTDVKTTTVQQNTETQSYTKDTPFPGKILVKEMLSKSGSNKETMHYEIDISGSDISYNAGDCFGFIPVNNDNIISEVLRLLNKSGNEVIKDSNEFLTLYDVLKKSCLQHISVNLLLHVAQKNNYDKLNTLLQNDDLLADYLQNNHILDVLIDFPSDDWNEQEFVTKLRKLQTRLYSVASSSSKEPTTVAFTIETLRYKLNNRETNGVASCWLADSLVVSDIVPIYLVKNSYFHLPTDDSPIIMIGPGTGIAPFRGFLQEIEHRGLQNKTWLFFGHQHENCDYLYGDEINSWIQNGTLDKVSLAWSRDQENKVYVQDKLYQDGKEIWSLIQNGAYIYVCGDGKNMAPAVAETFQRIAEEYGSVPSKSDWFQSMIASKRYRTDVY